MISCFARAQSVRTMAELADEDDFPNDFFDGLDFDNIPGLQAPTASRDTPEVFVASSAVPRSVLPSSAASPVPSTWSNSIEDMDPAFLAAVDALEARALSEMPRGKESRRFRNNHEFINIQRFSYNGCSECIIAGTR